MGTKGGYREKRLLWHTLLPLVLGMLTMLAACGDAHIEQFTATPPTIFEGDFVHLEWKVSNGEKCKLSTEGVEKNRSVDPNSDLWLNPAATSVYTLECESKDDDKSDQESLVVTVIPAEDTTIYFEGTPTVVQSGDSVLLAWDVTFPDTCTINPGNIDAPPPTGFITVNPAEFTTYTLTCSLSVDPVNLSKAAYAVVQVTP